MLGKQHRHRHNQERPHSSLDYQTPVEFAQRCLAAALFPPNTKPTTRSPKTTKHAHSEWIKNRGQATLISRAHAGRSWKCGSSWIDFRSTSSSLPFEPELHAQRAHSLVSRRFRDVASRLEYTDFERAARFAGH